MTLKPIPMKPVEGRGRKGENCPTCHVPTIWKRMPCPEGKPGCATIHYGWQCPLCGVFYRKVKDAESNQENTNQVI